MPPAVRPARELKKVWNFSGASAVRGAVSSLKAPAAAPEAKSPLMARELRPPAAPWRRVFAREPSERIAGDGRFDQGGGGLTDQGVDRRRGGLFGEEGKEEKEEVCYSFTLVVFLSLLEESLLDS